MLDFFKFLLKCIWHIGPSNAGFNYETDMLYAYLGNIGILIFTVFFCLISWFMVKSKSFVLKSFKLEIAVSMLLSLLPVILYFFIAYRFV